VRQVRERVRFGEGMRTLEEEGVRTYVELGVDGTLSGLGAGCVREEAEFVRAVEEGRSEAEAVVRALGRLHAMGQEVDWGRVHGGGRRVELPTYAFQRQRYWLEAAGGGAGEVGSAGLGAAEHPLLGAAVELAEGEGEVLTGRLSLAGQGWLGEHRVQGRVLVPGTAYLELALHAGGRVGLERVEELTLERPLEVPEVGGVQVQVVVGGADGEGRRRVGFHSRPEGEAAWTRHATGLLGPARDERAPGPAPSGGGLERVEGVGDGLHHHPV